MRISINVLLAFLAALLYRNGRLWYNALLPIPLPEFYVRGGASCETITHRESSQPFSSCEHATFWSTLSHGKQLLLSCDPGRSNWNTVMGPLRDPSPRGALWVYSYLSKTSKPRLVALDGYPIDKDFHPLGFAVSPEKPNEWSQLYVVNHGRHNSTIEHFALSPFDPKSTPRAVYVRTIDDKALVAPNSIALTSPYEFYLTNDHRFTRRIPFIGAALSTLEGLLLAPISWVSHVKLDPRTGKTAFTTVVNGHSFPNGIAVHPTGHQVALASSAMARITYYTRNPSTNALTYNRTVEVPFLPDNLEYTENGSSLVVAGHPTFPRLVQLAASKTPHAPSWVVAISPRLWDVEIDKAPLKSASRVPISETDVIQTLYQSDGSHYSASTTALVDETTNALLINGLYSDGILRCIPPK